MSKSSCQTEFDRAFNFFLFKTITFQILRLSYKVTGRKESWGLEESWVRGVQVEEGTLIFLLGSRIG